MLIRKAHAGDCGAICALFQQVDALHVAGRPEMFQTPAQPFRTPESIQALLIRPSDALFVAVLDEVVVGAAWLITRTAPDLPIFVPRRIAVVETLAVDEAARRQGVGRALMEYIEQWATENGCYELQLLVHYFNTGAREFYANLGYEVVEQRLRLPLHRG